MAPATKTGDNIEIGTRNSAEDGTTLSLVAASGFGKGSVLQVTHSGGMASPVIGLRADSDYVGVYGSSQNGIGVYGISRNSIGVYGNSQTHVGVFGLGRPFAGYFDGDVYVSGTLTAAAKNAVVSFPDGSHRLLHCVESPEHWFEDFGSARLMRGRATVKLDADFAKVVKLSDYRVFLTPEGDCRGLFVKSKRGKSFEVRELQGGAHSITFSYRIVAKRKDIKAHTRFAKMNTRVPMPTGTQRQGRRRKTAESFPRTLAAAPKRASNRA